MNDAEDPEPSDRLRAARRDQRLFGYAHISDKHMGCCYDRELTEDDISWEADQKAYEAFIEIASRNRAREIRRCLLSAYLFKPSFKNRSSDWSFQTCNEKKPLQRSR